MHYLGYLLFGPVRRLYIHIPSVGDLNQLITVTSNNTAALFVIFIGIGVCSIPLFVVGIELGAALTRNPDESASVLWFLCVLFFLTNRSHQRLNFHPLSGNVLSVLFVLGQPRIFYPSLSVVTLLISTPLPTYTSFFAVQSVVRASPTASPPLNMHNAIVFNSDWVVSCFHLVFVIQKKKLQREGDEEERTQDTRLDDIATSPPQENLSESVKA